MTDEKGFTLIEVIIVIVILGVLATLSLPRITGQIEASRGAEAVSMLGTLRRAALQCSDVSGSEDVCYKWSSLGVTHPGVNALFTYTAFADTVNDHIGFKATRNANKGGDGTSALCIRMKTLLNDQTTEYSVVAPDGTTGMNAFAGAVNNTGQMSNPLFDCTGWIEDMGV